MRTALLVTLNLAILAVLVYWQGHVFLYHDLNTGIMLMSPDHQSCIGLELQGAPGVFHNCG